MKRARVRQTPLQPQRSPSPTLPLHLYTSLASSSCSSSSAAIDAREATLLDPRDCNDTLDTLERVIWSGWIHDDSHEQQRREVITDRYDILHLVSSIPSLPAPPTDIPESGWGFEDLPLDHEELFFLNSSADRADLERRKKRRKLQDERDHRVRERLLQQQGDAGGAGDGGSHNDDEDDDKQPPAEINQLMSRLHTTLSRSANPALLELRILANHGSDPRFASFLKREGRWYQWWVDLREGNEVEVGARGAAKEEEEEEEEKPATSATGGLGGLAAYGSDSDDDGASSSNEEDDEDEDGLDAQDRSEAQVEDDAEQRASSSSKSPRPESASVAVPESVSTITLTSSSATTTSSSSTVTSALPPPHTGLGTSGNGNTVESTIAQGVKAVVEGEYQSGDYANRQEEEEEEEKEKKEARAAKAREWARKRREAREGGKDAVELA